ncbi:unnamed protein product [Effrenium voratum]|uniref:Uncharacterized protein n=1 Tax=Effrenium voratum TaxID=2562239 RepID=A0AA36NAD6_9DINO|nr:unnamed protein product [Effrenium voratum]
MVGSLSTVLLQSSSETIYLAGTMVSSQQLDIHKGILLAIGTTVGASFLPLLVAMMPCDRLHLTRAVWGVASFQLMKLFALLSCALLLVPAEMLSHGQLLGFTQVLVDHMGEIGINYVNPATWVVKPLSDALVKINQWRLKAFVLGPQEVSYVAAARCLSNSCGYSCLSDQVQDTWQSLDAQQYKALDVCSEFFGTANCTGDRPWCLLSGNMFWDVVVEQPNLFEVGGVVSGFICGLVFLSGASVFFLRDLSKMGRCRKVVEKVVAVPSALASFGVMVFTLLLMHDSVFVVCVLTPLCGLGLLPAPKMMCWAMAAEVGAALALIARGATELPFAEGVVQMAWVQLFCSILAVLLTALPCVRRLACHCGLLCATASHEFLIFLVVWAAGIPAVLAGMFAVSLLWDSSPSFTVCILLVVLPLVMATVIWCCLRSEWLLPIDVREQVREECERCEVATRPATAVQSPTSPNRLSPPGLRPVSPHRDRAESATPATQCVSPPRAANISPQFRSPVPVINVRSPPSNQTQMKTPSLSASPANEMPHLEVLEATGSEDHCAEASDAGGSPLLTAQRLGKYQQLS